MSLITDRQMQAKPRSADLWIIEPAPRGHGRFMGRITPTGERLFYFRYTRPDGERDTLLIGAYGSDGQAGRLTVERARDTAGQWRELYRSGVSNLREHFAGLAESARLDAERDRADRAAAMARDAEAAAAAELDRQRRPTVRQLFERWAATELVPHKRADGKRAGRKDSGKFAREQFERRVFPRIGSVAAADLRKADLFAILDSAKAEGKLRTCNVLLANLKQMLRFAVRRDIIVTNPLEAITKRDAGGAEASRVRVLSADEIATLAVKLPAANMHKRSELAVWIILATGCRIGELLSARWEHLDIPARTWHLPVTKNEREHTIHLSSFALARFAELLTLRELGHEWVFPNSEGLAAVCVKSFGKQLSDRQRPPERRMTHRSKLTESLVLAGGRWTAHDLRRTAATLMARLGISGDVIDECLNHLIESRVRRTYILDRRVGEQARAFDALGARLQAIVTGGAETNVVPIESARIAA